VERAMLAHPTKPWFVDTDLYYVNGYRTKMGPRKRNVAVDHSQHHVIDSTNSCRALDDGIEHRLDIGRRAADDAEHLGCSGLMLQRLAQFCVALAEFFEQAHVLDGDDGLSGEGLQKFYLLIGKRADLDPANDNCADGDAFSQQRRRQHGSLADVFLDRFDFRVLSIDLQL